MTSKYDEDFFESESSDLDDDFADGLSSPPGRSAGIAAPTPRSAASKSSGGNKTRIKPMPEAISKKMPGISSMVCTFEGGRQIIYLRKRGS